MNRLKPPLSALIAIALAGCAARAATTNAPAAIPVTLATAAAPGSKAAYAGPGSVVPQHIYRVAFEVAGRIVSVNADVGDRVAAGTVLAALDGSDYAAQARGAQAQALQASAAAAKARNGARVQERLAAEDAVASARAQLDRAVAAQRLAFSNKTRFDQLYASGDVAAQQHDQVIASARDADAAVTAARAQLQQAQAQESLVRVGSRSEDITASVAAANAARAGADLANVTLAKTHIIAPADAYVDQRLIEPGSTAQPGVTAFVLVDAREPDVLVAVPEARLDGITPGTPASIRSNAHTYHGTVTRIEPQADAASRTAQVRIRTSGLQAHSGGVVDVAIGASHLAGDATIPLGALVTGTAGETHVLVYDPARKTAAERSVRVVSGDGEHALVIGVAPGTRIVRAGAALVKPGTTLTVVPE